MFFSSGFGSVGARRLLRGLVEWSSVLDTRGLSNCWSVGSWIQKGVEGDRSGRDRRCVCMTLWQEREWRPRLSWDEGLYSPPPFSLTIPYKVMNVMNAVAFVVKYCQHVQGDVSGLCPCLSYCFCCLSLSFVAPLLSRRSVIRTWLTSILAAHVLFTWLSVVCLLIVVLIAFAELPCPLSDPYTCFIFM